MTFFQKCFRKERSMAADMRGSQIKVRRIKGQKKAPAEKRQEHGERRQKGWIICF